MNKITEARRAKGWTQAQLAERMGVTQQAVQRYESASRDLKASVLKRLSQELGVTITYLLGMTDDEPARPMAAEVPLFDSVDADRPDPSTAAETWPVPASVRERYPDAFLLRVRDDSVDRILPRGCYALVDPCVSIEYDGQPYVVRSGEDGATVRRVRRLAYGLELSPDSSDPTYHPQVFDRGLDAEEPTVVGRVVWHCLPEEWSY